jgi:hypothetical protein
VGVEVRFVEGPYNGLSYDFPDGTVRDPGTPMFLPYSYASDRAGLAYLMYEFRDDPSTAHFVDWVNVNFERLGDEG